MGRPALAICLVLGMLCVLPCAVQADEVADLKAQFQAMEERHQSELAALQARIQSLEAAQRTRQVAAAPAATGSLTERVDALEEDLAFVHDKDQALADQLNEKINFDMYAVQEFENFDGSDASFNARSVELLVNAKLTDRLEGYAAIEFERAANVSGGDRRSGDIEVEAAWMGYRINELATLRFGALVVPFGNFNNRHFAPSQDLTDRPIAMRDVVPVTWTEGGVSLYGDYFIGEHLPGHFDDITFAYQAAVINGLTATITDTGMRDARGSFGSDNNNNKALVGRLGIRHGASQELGISGYAGAYNNESDNLNGMDVDWRLTHGPAELVGEWAWWDLQDGFQETTAGVATATTTPSDLNGGYVEGRYHFWFDGLDNTFLGRGFDSPTFTLVGRYGRASIADDGDAGIGNNVEERWTLGLNYRPVETWVLKLEYQNNRTKTEALERGDADGILASVAAAF